MDDGNGNGNGNGNGKNRQNLHTGLQIGTIVAGVSFVAYLLQPVNVELGRVGAQLQQHISEPGHAQVLAQISALLTQVTAVRTEIAGLDRLNSTLHDAGRARLDRTSAMVGLLDQRVNDLLERLARVEVAISVTHNASMLLGGGTHPNRVTATPCYTACHKP